MLATNMRACAVAPACTSSARRTSVVFRHQMSRPACAAPARLRVTRRAGAVAVHASTGPDARETQPADETEATTGLAQRLSLAAVLASPLLLDAQARASFTSGRRMWLHGAAVWRHFARHGPRTTKSARQAGSRTRSRAALRPARAQDALAAGGAYGILEGRTGALVHPALMFFLFGATGFTGYLGWQWRRVRTIPDEVAQLKALLPKAPATGASACVPNAAQSHAAAALARLKRLWCCARCGLRLRSAGSAAPFHRARSACHCAAPNAVLTRAPPARRLSCAVSASPLRCAADATVPALSAAQVETQQKIDALTEERKALLAEGVRDKHFNWGSLLLALGVAIGVEGPVNTYLRTGKLFPGPHLYAGAGIVVLWAVAAACVPQMQKGNDTARSVHIALNCVNLALFAWQARAARQRWIRDRACEVAAMPVRLLTATCAGADWLGDSWESLAVHVVVR